MFIKSQMVLDNGQNTTVLDVDLDEFITICNILKKSEVKCLSGELTRDVIKSMVDNGVIPYIGRGYDTKELFEKYKTDDNYLTVLLSDPQTLLEIFQSQGGKIETIL